MYTVIILLSIRKMKEVMGTMKISQDTNQLLQGKYRDLLLRMKEAKQAVTLDYLAAYENRVPAEVIYSFLNYLIATEDSASNRILLCNYLMYLNEFFDDIYIVVRYQILRPARTIQDRAKLYEWALFAFDGGNPDSPFSESDLIMMRDFLSQSKMDCADK